MRGGPLTAAAAAAPGVAEAQPGSISLTYEPFPLAVGERIRTGYVSILAAAASAFYISTGFSSVPSVAARTYAPTSPISRPRSDLLTRTAQSPLAPRFALTRRLRACVHVNLQVATVMRERRSAARLLLRLSGASGSAYVASNALHDLALHSATSALSLAFLAAVRVPGLSAPRELRPAAALFWVFGFGALGWASAASQWFKTPERASAVLSGGSTLALLVVFGVYVLIDVGKEQYEGRFDEESLIEAQRWIQARTRKGREAHDGKGAWGCAARSGGVSGAGACAAC